MQRDKDPVCWKCGTAIADHPLPLSRSAECAACRADLHVCLQCKFYDRSVAKHCRETIAEQVQAKDRANFCGYFELKADAHLARSGAGSQPDKALEALFGLGEGAGSVSPSEPDAARAELAKLFGMNENNKT